MWSRFLQAMPLMLSKPTIYHMNKSALALVPYNRHHFLPVNRQGKDHSMKLPAAGVRSDRYLLPASELQQTSCTSLLLLIETTDRQLDGHRTIAQTLNARSGALSTRGRRDDMPTADGSSKVAKIVADLRPSADGSAVLTSLVAGGV